MILYWSASSAFATWALSSILFKTFNLPATRLVRILAGLRAELHPFALAFVVIRYLSDVWLHRSGDPYFNKDAALGLFVMAMIWWNNRHGDDNRWKRRRKRALARVRVTAAGLRVVPANR